MATAIGPFRLGQHLTAITIAGATIAANGAVSLGAAQNMVGVIDDLDHRVVKDVEDVRPLNSLQMNEVITGIGNRIRVTELKRSWVSSVLHNIVDDFDHCFVAWVEGNETFGGYFVIGEMTGGMHGHGRQTVSIDCGPIALSDVAQVVRTAV